MKVTLESTTKTVTLVIDGHDVPARIWEGTTANGIPCHAYITRIAVAADLDATEFERDLLEKRRATSGVESIPSRLIL